MSTYKLIYAGEVLDGQHQAVVRKRLMTLLKLDDERMDVLFSGKPVVVKKAADESMKARYLTAFEKAGAKLQVQPLEPMGSPPQPGSVPPSKAPAQESDTAELAALPVGADILSASERTEFVPADIDTDHLKVAGAVFVTDSDEPVSPGPSVDHLSLAEPGATLGQAEADEEFLEIDADFDLADVGADMGSPDPDPVPDAPDTSHIKLED